MTTWAHRCNSTGNYSTIPLDQECTACGINNVVETTRYAGFAPLPASKKPLDKPKRKLAALFMPFKRSKPETTEYETEFYDRHG